MDDTVRVPQTLDDVLATFREAARDNRDLGDLFERLIANYLVTDPEYKELFSDVWLWSEWPDRWGRGDTGIDLIAREAATGEYWAIQCKFYLPDHCIQKADIDSFLSASGKRFTTREGHHTFAQRLIVSTTDRWGRTAEDTIDRQQPPVKRLLQHHLADSPVDWSQFSLKRPQDMRLVPGKVLRGHQETALDQTRRGFQIRDRGKLIMACGTGKTFTALRIAEDRVAAGGRILFLAPSISLVAQTLREWTADADAAFHALVVCSDTKVGRDQGDMRVHDLPYPATTDADRLARYAERFAARDAAKRTVVFSTYQSIQAVSDAQKQGLGDFDLIICDEAHRTTGLTRAGEDASDFVKVHDNTRVAGAKRLYMTATPRIFAEASKTKAADKDAELYSMDDENRFGPVFHRLGFGEAVRKDLLCDYRVLLVAVDESKMAHTLNAYSAALDDDDKPPKALDSRFVAKIFGSWKGLAKKDVRLIGEAGEDEAPAYDRQPMRRAIAFSRSIDSSKTLTDTFPKLIDMYRQETSRAGGMGCDFRHVDGSMNALARQQKLDWLKADDGEDVCRVLSNARCLSEGIDVPALDGVVFFDTRESVVDIVQSVGRVMRKPADNITNKKYGYIVLPVGIPSDALDKYDHYISTDKQFKGIWKVIKALRAHDESLVDEVEFRNKIQIIDGGGENDGDDRQQGEQLAFDLPPLPVGDISEAVYAAIPKKLGDTAYWQDWAEDVARIAQNVIGRIDALLEQPKPREAFDGFVDSLRKNINPAETRESAVEMLAQHLVTRPVFDALFPQRPMQDNNPVSQAMEAIVAHMDRHGVESETGELARFYESIRERAVLAKSEKSRQELIRSLYDSFFATAFADVARNLGIVYTPVEIVDFILHSANDALAKHFDRRLSDENVHLLDPFSGTGTFITRLLHHTHLIDEGDLVRKYQNELHANEIVLLAYYVASVNIESAFRARFDVGDTPEASFPGIVLTDTFQMTEARDWVDDAMLAENSERIQRQKETPIKVIVGNPPYSVRQGGTKYPRLDGRIGETYAKHSNAKNKNSLYDSYMRAIRWASDRIEDQGIVAFVTNGGWLDGNTSAGVRKCLGDEFSAVYVFNLRGHQRTSGELSRQEGGKIFGSGSRAPIAITLLVKTPEHTGPAEIHYHDIGDYLSTREKLDRIAEFGSYRAIDWQPIQPNIHHDWLNKRSEDFYKLKPISGDEGIFATYQRGVETSREPWVYSFSKTALSARIQKMIAFYNAEVDRVLPELQKEGEAAGKLEAEAKKRVSSDKAKIKWTSSLLQQLVRDTRGKFDTNKLTRANYRPFGRQWLYYDNLFNHRYKARLWPTPAHSNRVIQITGTGSTTPFSCLMSDCIPDLEVISKGQCYPLYRYEKEDPDKHAGFFCSKDAQDGYVRHDAITDNALADFQARYSDDTITKKGLFYYTYGVLHSPEYRHCYAGALKKDATRIPYASDFHAFRKAGEALAELHTDYESVEPYPLTEQSDALDLDPAEHYQITKMKHAGKQGEPDRSVIVVNDNLRLAGIPDKAHEYIVNGKSALAWVMEQYKYNRDKDSGIVNDPNEWSDDPRYIVDLIKRVVTVSVETIRIVESLPPIEERPKTTADSAAWAESTA